MKDVGEPTAGDILERLKLRMDVQNDRELADVLGVAPSTLSSWRQRDSLPYAFCVKLALEIRCSLDWLILGEDWYRSVAPPASYAFEPLQRVLSELRGGLSEVADNPASIGRAVAEAKEILKALDGFLALQVKAVDLQSAVQQLIDAVEKSGPDDASPPVD